MARKATNKNYMCHETITIRIRKSVWHMYSRSRHTQTEKTEYSLLVLLPSPWLRSFNSVYNYRIFAEPTVSN